MSDSTLSAGSDRAVARVAAPICVALVAAQICGAIVGRAFLPPGTQYHAGSIWRQLALAWDGLWYHRIGMTGYAWNPAVAKIHYQNVAFFPVQGIIDRLATIVAGPHAFMLIVLVSLASGLASIFQFERLARAVIGDAAVPATALYAFWPASSFYLTGYPVGIISLCVIGALRAHVEGRNRAAALWLGIGSATAPSVVFVGAALGGHHLIRWGRGGASLRRLMAIAAWGLLALSGLLAFMAYQAIAFHDPLAFVQAQEAWGSSPGIFGTVRALLDPRQYIKQPLGGLEAITHGRDLIRAGHSRLGALTLQIGIQNLISLVAFLLAVFGLAAASRALRGRYAVIAWAGWAAFGGYLWFIVANEGMVVTPRLTFPAIAIFLGLGVLARRAARLTRVMLIGLFLATSCMEMAFAAAGMFVV